VLNKDFIKVYSNFFKQKQENGKKFGFAGWVAGLIPVSATWYHSQKYTQLNKLH
jgi:hypothetical protein